MHLAHRRRGAGTGVGVGWYHRCRPHPGPTRVAGAAESQNGIVALGRPGSPCARTSDAPCTRHLLPPLLLMATHSPPPPHAVELSCRSLPNGGLCRPPSAGAHVHASATLHPPLDCLLCGPGCRWCGHRGVAGSGGPGAKGAAGMRVTGGAGVCVFLLPVPVFAEDGTLCWSVISGRQG